MVQRILNFSISLILCLLIGLPLQAQTSSSSSSSRQGTQQQKKKEKAKPEIEYPLYNGLSVGLDLWGPASKALGGDFLSTDVSVCADLKHRYFPTVEIGYGTTDTQSEENGISYKTNAPYLRIGMDYNMLFKKAHGHMLLLGFRYGMSSFKYDVVSMGIDDPIYGGSYNPDLTDDVWQGSIPYRHTGMKGSMQWLEMCFGIRARVSGQISMGWAMRFKFKLSASPDTYGDPWYVPGFGKYGSNTIGISYTIVYHLPTHKEKK